MTVSEIFDLHDGAIQSLARRYREEGYDVIVEPRVDDLPPPFQSFRPDLLARRGTEGVIAEVKRRRPASRERWAEVERMAEAARNLPGWRFDLMVIDDNTEGPEAEGHDWSTGEIRRALADAEELIDRSSTAPALLLLFAALEAQLRALATIERVAIPARGVGPLASALTTEGVLSRKDYRALMDALAVRNAVAHGLTPDAMPDQAALRRLLAIARRLGRT
jgi:hypothetical protein